MVRHGAGRRCAQLLAALLVLALSSANADPDLWRGSSCDAHPTSRQKRHGAPSGLDSSTTFVVAKGGSAVSALCPGQSYAVSVAYSSSRETLLSSSQGSLGSSGSCPNRVNFVNKAQSHGATLTVGCTLSGSITLRATSATGETGSLLTQTASLTIDPSCAAASCTGSTTATSKPPSPPPPRPSPPPSSTGGGNATSSTTGAPAPTARPAAVTCPTSALGYHCSKPLSHGAVMHWSTGGGPPSTACTQSMLAAGPPPGDAAASLHLAIESPLQGYLSLAFAQRPGKMYPASAIIGSVDGSDMAVNAVPMDSYTVRTGDALADAANWASYRGIVQTPAGTVMCFTVQLSSSPSAAAAAGRRLLLGRGLFATGGSTDAAPTLDPAEVSLVWAVNDVPQYTTHTAKGGVKVNTVTGAATTVSGAREMYIIVHGSLMALCWVLLLPLGLLCARHRWVLRGRKAGQKELWFYIHVGCQLAGVVLFVVAIIIAFTMLGTDGGDGTVRQLKTAHKALGISLAGLAGLQLVVAFVRPAPTAPRRPAWNFVHHNLGRLAVLTSWAAVYVGIWLTHMGDGMSLGAWLWPVVAVMGLLVGADVLLTLLGPSLPAPAPAGGGGATATAPPGASPAWAQYAEGGAKGAPGWQSELAYKGASAPPEPAQYALAARRNDAPALVPAARAAPGLQQQQAPSSSWAIGRYDGRA